MNDVWVAFGRFFLLTIFLLLTSCRHGVGSVNPREPVPIRWTVVAGTQSAGAQLLLQGGHTHAIPSEVRLRDRFGKVLARAPAAPILSDHSAGLRPGMTALGLIQATLALPEHDAERFGDGWPRGYKLEAWLYGAWRRVELIHVPCAGE